MLQPNESGIKCSFHFPSSGNRAKKLFQKIMLLYNSKVFIQCLALLVLLFQCFRFGTLVLFSIFMVDCTLWHLSSSVECAGFQLFAHPFVWKIIRLCCSACTCLLCLCSLNTFFLPTLRPARTIQVVGRLLGNPVFWSGNFQLLLVIFYDAFTIWENPRVRFVTSIGILAAFTKLLTLCLVYQLNFTKPPERNYGFGLLARMVYRITLVAFAADNLVLFLGETTQVAYKIYSLRWNHERSFEPTVVACLMMRVVNASFYYYLWDFFWSKIFHGHKDILTTYRANLRDQRAMH